MLKPADAEFQIAQHPVNLPIESLPLIQCAGAVLREDVRAERDQPPFDRVAMDGIALDSSAVASGCRQFRIQAAQMAGQPPLALKSNTHCIEVMTGAVLPVGCDAVIQVEHLKIDSGEATLTDKAAARPWQNVHQRASDSRKGDHLLLAGSRLGAPQIAVAASAGKDRLLVGAQPSIVVISTGDELVDPGAEILPHQIRRSNSYGIAASLRGHGFSRVADDHIADDLVQLRERLRVHLENHNVLILSGGVSMGRLDLVPQALADLGVREVFHRIEQRPGKPMWFGAAPRGAIVYALPGNPVSTLVCLARYVIPALLQAMGLLRPEAPQVALAEAVQVPFRLAYFLPVKLIIDAEARAWATPHATRGSGDFISLADTDGFIELPAGPGVSQRGFVTRLYRW